jgi:hypothetical protein
LSQEKTSCGMRRRGWSPFQKTRSRSVSNNGGSAGRSVCITKETTWRELGFCTSKSINVFLPTKGSILFEHTT